MTSPPQPPISAPLAQGVSGTRRISHSSGTEHLLAGRYEMIEPIGKGGMGEVWRGLQHSLNRPVAIKLLRAEGCDAPAQRFHQEASILARLDHPNLVRVTDFGYDESLDNYYFVMDLVEGESLMDIVRRGPLPLEASLQIARELAEVLTYVHGQGVVHRDLKPENVMFKVDSLGHRQMKLIDFGIAYRTDADARITTNQVLGSMRFMSPEQLRGQIPDARTDIYAVGGLLFGCLAGRPVFRGKPLDVAAQKVTLDPPSLMDVGVMVPAAVEAVVAQCLRRDPAERYASATELVAALNALPPQATSETAPVRRTSKRAQLLTVAAAAMLLLGAGAPRRTHDAGRDISVPPFDAAAIHGAPVESGLWSPERQLHAGLAAAARVTRRATASVVSHVLELREDLSTAGDVAATPEAEAEAEEHDDAEAGDVAATPEAREHDDVETGGVSPATVPSLSRPWASRPRAGETSEGAATDTRHRLNWAQVDTW